MNILKKTGHNPGILLFIHGNSSSSKIFESIFDSTLPYTLISFDLPGHGNSPRYDKYSMKDFMLAIKSIIQQLENEKLILVGNSLGGHLSLEMAQQLQNLNGLMIFGTPPLTKPVNLEEAYLPNQNINTFFTEEPTKEDIDNLFEDLVFNKSVLPIIKKDFLNTDPKVRSCLGAELASSDALQNEKDIFLELDIQKCILQGVNDSMVNVEFLNKVKIESGENTELIQIENCGHYPTLEQSEFFLEQLNSFCKKVF